MPRINLLPWREELRNQRNKDFGVAAVVVAVLMGCIVGVVHFYYVQEIEFQQRRNAFLESETAKLDKKIKSGQLFFVLPVEVGKVEIVGDVTEEELLAAL